MTVEHLNTINLARSVNLLIDIQLYRKQSQKLNFFSFLKAEPSYTVKPESVAEKENSTHICESLIGSPKNVDEFGMKVKLCLRNILL